MQTNELIIYENRNSKSILLKNFRPILTIVVVMVKLVGYLFSQMKFVLHVLHYNAFIVIIFFVTMLQEDMAVVNLDISFAYGSFGYGDAFQVS